MNIYLYFCRIMKKLPYILLLLYSVASCTKSNITEKLSRVDSLVVLEKYDSAFSLLSEIKEPSIESEADKAHYNLILTQVSYLVNKPLASDSILDLSMTYYHKVKDNEKLADCYYYKANRLVSQKDFSMAIKCLKEAESKAKGISQHYKIAERLAFLNKFCGNYILQLKYAKRSLDLAVSSGNKNKIAYSYQNIASAFSYLDQYDSALYYVNKTIPYIIYIDEKNKAGFWANIGMLYKEKDLNKAKEYLLKSIDSKETSGALENLAEIYYTEGNQEEAYRLWKKALTINDGDYKDNIILNILSYDIEHGNVDKVCDNIDEIIHIKDSMLHQLKNDTIKDLQLRFDHEVAMRKQEQIISNWKIGGLALTVMLLLLAIYAIVKRYKSKVEMQEKQMQIINYQSQIREYEASCKDAKENIEWLKKQIIDKLEEISPQLKRGQLLYEQIKDGQVKSIYNWRKEDEKHFVEFYKFIDYRTVDRLTSVKRVEPLTNHRLFFLLLKEMGKNDSQIQELLGISSTAIKVLRSRVKVVE